MGRRYMEKVKRWSPGGFAIQDDEERDRLKYLASVSRDTGLAGVRRRR